MPATQVIVTNSDLFHEMTFTSASCACVVSMQALEGFALASHILIVLSTEHDANTWQTKKNITMSYEIIMQLIKAMR